MHINTFNSNQFNATEFFLIIFHSMFVPPLFHVKILKHHCIYLKFPLFYDIHKVFQNCYIKTTTTNKTAKSRFLCRSFALETISLGGFA